MYNAKKIVVVMPAYNAQSTLLKTHKEVMDLGLVDLVIIVDDRSQDGTWKLARSLPHTIAYRHETNKGYGANQKTCYRLALEAGGDIIVMVHADYQYTPKLIPAMVSLIANNLYHCVMGSRILGGYALKGGMPVWKYLGNRLLTLIENLFINAKLSEYHTGFRAFSKELLLRLPIENNSNKFVFDNQMIAQILWHGYQVAEVTCPTKYFSEASSINFFRSLEYGFGCLQTALTFRLAKHGILKSQLFPYAKKSL